MIQPMSITDVPGVGPALRERVAEEVRALMGRRRTTGAQLARAIGVPQSSLSRKLTGRYPLDVDDLEAIAAYFEIPVASLIPAEEETIGSWFPTFGDVPVLTERAA
jgi:transcriptional regulator with XRE-family HTH domain